RFLGAKRTETGWADGVFLLHAWRKGFFNTLSEPFVFIIARPTENVKTKFNKFTGPLLCGILSACRKSFFPPLSKFPELYKSSENLGF
ncbi:MAG: hypothetical protein MRZ31_00075, partial [Dysosmobacter sp.]|uniref:hypothetical protein n=1 Tax=Dysosmobacter sp. TaxID=2591382 RepID=UPI002673D2DA